MKLVGRQLPTWGNSVRVAQSLIAMAYYGSEIGQKELGWDGESINGPYEGCTHRARPTPRHSMAQDVLQQTYDAIVVGSGATVAGRQSRLSEAGLKVALVEAGRPVTAREFTEHMPAFQLKYRNHSPEVMRTRPIQRQCYACMEYNYEWFVNDLENPYSTPPDKPFTWQRLRVLGADR